VSDEFWIRPQWNGGPYKQYYDNTTYRLQHPQNNVVTLPKNKNKIKK
jgi:hypothetical protein